MTKPIVVSGESTKEVKVDHVRKTGCVRQGVPKNTARAKGGREMKILRQKKRPNRMI
jgi:hypothetical protein